MRLPSLLLAAILIHLTAGEAKSPYPLIDWTGAEAGKTGESEGVLKHPKTGVQVMTYKLHAPNSLPKERTLGLIVGFHGLGGNEAAAGAGYWPMRELGLDQGYLCAGGKSMGNGWEPSDEPNLMQFIDWLETIYPIDHRRVFFWGHSNGGWAVGYYGNRYTDRVAGIVRWAGYGVFVPNGKDAANTLLEYYLIHGDSDPTVDVSGSRNLRLGLMAQDVRYVYREIIGGDHGNILGLKPVSRDAALWVDALRHKSIPPPDADLATIRTLAKAKDAEFAESLAKPGTWAELVRVGSAYGWAVVGKAMKSKDAALRLAAVQACAKTTFAGEETDDALAKLLEDADPAVRSAAIGVLGIHANWHGTLPQMALAKLAMNKKCSDEDRIAATKALAGVLPLPFLGNFSDDPTAFQGLTALLNSDLQPIREAAWAPIATNTTEDFGYNPAAEEGARKRGIIAWQNWYNGRTGLVDGKSAKR